MALAAYRVVIAAIDSSSLSLNVNEEKVILRKSELFSGPWQVYIKERSSENVTSFSIPARCDDKTDVIWIRRNKSNQAARGNWTCLLLLTRVLFQLLDEFADSAFDVALGKLLMKSGGTFCSFENSQFLEYWILLQLLVINDSWSKLVFANTGSTPYLPLNYPWRGNGKLMGKLKNPLIPKI